MLKERHTHVFNLIRERLEDMNAKCIKSIEQLAAETEPEQLVANLAKSEAVLKQMSRTISLSMDLVGSAKNFAETELIMEPTDLSRDTYRRLSGLDNGNDGSRPAPKPTDLLPVPTGQEAISPAMRAVEDQNAASTT